MFDQCGNFYGYNQSFHTLQTQNNEKMMILQQSTPNKIIPSPLLSINQATCAYSQPIMISTTPINAYGMSARLAPSQFVSFDKSSKRNSPSKSAKTRSALSKKEKSKDVNNQRKKFSPDEDEKLKKLVEEMGSKKWDKIAKEMPGRTGRQCRDRYKNYLIPGFFNGQWSREEDDMLREKFFEYGSQWSKITEFFKNRSANALKNRWNYFVSRHLDKQFPVSAQNLLTTNNVNEITDYQVSQDDALYENIADFSPVINPIIDTSYDIYDIVPMNENEELSFKEDCFEFPYINKN